MRHALAGFGVLAISLALPFSVHAQKDAVKYYLGIKLSDKADSKLGYQVVEVFPDSPALKTKDAPKRGDFITGVNQKPVTTWEKLKADVMSSPKGLVTFTVTDPKSKKARTVSIQMVAKSAKS